MTTLRFNRRNLTLSTSLFAAVLILVSALFYQAVVNPLFATGSLTVRVFSVFMGILVLVVIFMGVFQVIQLWTYRIEFNEAFLETHMARVPFAWQFKCAYTDITLVRKLVPGTIEMV